MWRESLVMKAVDLSKKLNIIYHILWVYREAERNSSIANDSTKMCEFKSTATGKLKQQQKKDNKNLCCHPLEKKKMYSNVQCCKDNPVKFSDPVPNRRVSRVSFKNVL